LSDAEGTGSHERNTPATPGSSERRRRASRTLTGIILSLGTDELLHLAHVFPPWDQRASDALLLLATIYRTIYGVAGSYIATRLACNRPLLHAMILGAAKSASRSCTPALTAESAIR
jgi:hypothetical protein